jgi:hypothetical protein
MNPPRSRSPGTLRLGLRENFPQFVLLVVNAFVGAMVGLERSILPAMAEQEFQLVARTAGGVGRCPCIAGAHSPAQGIPPDSSVLISHGGA